MKSWISKADTIYMHPCLQHKVKFNLFWPGDFLPPEVFWISGRTSSVDVTQQSLVCSSDHLSLFGNYSAVSFPFFIWPSTGFGMCSVISPSSKKICFSPSAYQEVRIYSLSSRNMERQICGEELRLIGISADIMLHSASSRNFHLGFCFPVAAADSCGLKSCHTSLSVTHI